MKKALSLLLVLVLALSMGTVAFAAEWKEKARVTQLVDDDSWQADSNEYDVGDVSPSHSDMLDATYNNVGVIKLENTIDPDAWKKVDPAASDAVTKQILKDSKVTMEVKASKGGQFIDEINFLNDGDNTAVHGFEIVMVDTFASNNPDGVDFSYRCFLSIKKSVSSKDYKSTYNNPIIVSGTFKNATDEIEDEDFYSFADGRILEPQAFVKNLEGWLDDNGDGVLRMRALKGAKYWANGSHDNWTEKDDAITEKYPQIDGVYHITQKGLGNVVNNVEFPNYDPTYYVYTPDGETLKYVGRAGAKTLPLLDTYYFSVAELDVDEFEPEDEDGDDDEDWDYDENSEGGGDDLYPSNPHDNPGTGR